MISNKQEIFDKIPGLEESYGTEKFIDNYNRFFFDVCDYLNIPEHISNNILKSKDINLRHSIFLKFFSPDYSFWMKYKSFDTKNPYFSKEESNLSLKVEPIGSFGMYSILPSKEIVSSLSSYVFINNNPYLVTLIKGDVISEEDNGSYEDDGSYSEQKWADKETAIFIASINLSMDYGQYSFFLGEKTFFIPIDLYGFNIDKLNIRTIRKLNDLIEMYEFIYDITSEIKNNLARDFELNKNYNDEKIKEINKSIDRDNPILVRCLYYYAKACVYAQHTMTIEESTSLQLFCLDGLTRLLVNKYNLDSIDSLGSFLYEKFKCPFGEYLKECYEERTIYVHPENRYGQYWCPPWDADTCYDTLPIVKHILLIYLLEEYKAEDEYFVD